MKGVRNAVKKHQHFQYLLFIFIISIAIFQYRFFKEQKNENIALRLKILSLNEPKKTPKAFKELINKTTVLNKNLATMPKASGLNNEPEKELILQDLDTSILASLLKNKMKDVKNLEEKEIGKIIDIANEIISREPDSYSAYKAKLISLLILEGKFNNDVDDTEIENILENMAQFNLENESITRREAFLIATTDKEILNFETQIESLVLEREKLNLQLGDLMYDSPEYQEIFSKIQFQSSTTIVCIDLEQKGKCLLNNLLHLNILTNLCNRKI